MPVKLNNVLARDTARVGYIYLYGILAVRFKRAGVKPLHVPVEGSVRKPVAEGILHNPVIAIAVRVAYFIEITVHPRFHTIYSRNKCPPDRSNPRRF